MKLRNLICSLLVVGILGGTLSVVSINASAFPPIPPGKIPIISDALAKKADFVVLTTDHIKNNSKKLNDFIKEKERMGLSTDIVTESGATSTGSGWGGGKGNAAAEKIKAWLVKNYQRKNIKYVLLIGNPDPEKGDVPMKITHPIREVDKDGKVTMQRVIPTDLYYAEMNDDWDSNKNGFYGEYPSEVRNKLDITIGRIPVYSNDTKNLDKILDRTIEYTVKAMHPSARPVLLPMEPLKSNYDNTEIGESIKKEVLDPKGLKSFRIYDDNKHKPDLYPCTIQNVVKSWAKLDPGLVIWSTHGSATGATDVLNSNETTNLGGKNSEFVFSASCHNGTPEVSNNLAYKLLLDSSVGVFSSTRMTSWNSEDDYENYYRSSNGIAYNFAQNIIKNESIGEAYRNIVSGKTIKDRVEWRNLTEYNLYGDPTLKLSQFTKDIFATSKENSILAKWAENPWLGNKLTEIIPLKEGAFAHFEKGSIYYGDKVGRAHIVLGMIRNKWKDLGWENSFLGYPVTDETTIVGDIGWFNHFEHGSIYCKKGASSAYAISGDLFKQWEALGWEQGQMGFPTSDQYLVKVKTGEKIANRFEYGAIYRYYDPGTKMVNLKPGELDFSRPASTTVWPVMSIARGSHRGASPQKIDSVEISGPTSGEFPDLIYTVKGSGFKPNERLDIYISSVSNCTMLGSVKTDSKGSVTAKLYSPNLTLPAVNGVVTIWARHGGKIESSKSAIYSFKPANGVKVTNSTLE